MTDFDRIMREYGPSLWRLAGAWERDASAREDLLQEIVLALWRALPDFRGESSEKTFVFRVAHNRALSHRFRRGAGMETLDAAMHVADPHPSPEAEASASQRIEQLMRAMQTMPIAMRQVLTLALEGLSYAEIAAVLGITENNVGVRLNRARRALQEELNRQ